jgi:hypothetical protein
VPGVYLITTPERLCECFRSANAIGSSGSFKSSDSKT